MQTDQFRAARGGFAYALDRFLDLVRLVVFDRRLNQPDLDFACFHGGRKVGLGGPSRNPLGAFAREVCAG